MQTETHIEYFKRRSFGDLINITIEFIRINFKALIKSLLYIAGPAIIIISGIVLHLMSKAFNLLKNSVAGESDLFEGMIGEFIISIFLLLIVSFVGVVLLLCLSKAFLNTYQTDKEKLGDPQYMWSQCKKDFGTVSLNYFLSFFIVIIPFMLLLMPVFLVAAFVPIIGQLVLLAISAAFGMFYLLVLLISMLENKSIVDSVSRAFTLLKDSWMSATGYYLVINLMANFISIIFILPLYVMFIFYLLHNADPGSTPTFELPAYLEIISAVLFIFFIVSTVILYSFQVIGMGFQYYSLREHKESTGLLQKIESIGEDSSPEEKDEQF